MMKAYMTFNLTFLQLILLTVLEHFSFFFFFAVEYSKIILCSFSFEFLYAVVSMGYPKVNGDSYQYHALDDK